MLILSSQYEGFGNVIIEAMTLGVPVISTDCPSGPREIIGKNEYGELVEVGNFEQLAEKIYYLLKNSIRLNVLKLLGMKRAKEFELKRIQQYIINNPADWENNKNNDEGLWQ